MTAWRRVAFAMFTVGFGANLFAPMLLVYRRDEHLSQSEVTWLFAVYALGLIPSLILCGPLSDRCGRAAILRPTMIISALASVVLIVGAGGHTPLLILGRLCIGIAVGGAMSAGSAWIKELSTDNVTAGARRAVIAMSSGFGGGPLVSGLVADFAPAPQITPYVCHIALALAAIPLVFSVAPALGRPAAPHPTSPFVTWRGLFPPVVFSWRFLLTVATWAPWAFGAATVAFVVLPPLTSHSLSHPIAYAGSIAAVTMLTGGAIQPVAKRLHERGYRPLALTGLGLAAVGMALAAITVTLESWPWAVVAAVTLGASYGIMMVSGLLEVELLARPGELGALIGIFYSLTYVGFFVPFTLSLVAPHVGGYAVCMLFGVAVCIASMPLVLSAVRRAHRGDEAAA